MVIHLIDSPGHVDFSMEVSSALQICDGAILLVDVVEGMCARTQSILREAYSQRLVPVLVLNKVDRLCTDLGLTVNEAFVRIRNVIENVNAAASNMIFSARAQALDKAYIANSGFGVGDSKSTNHHDHDHDTDTDHNLDSDRDEEMEMIWNFDPVKGNVVFTSAIYGWGFTVPSLARSLFKSKMVNVKPPLMRQYLFGDFKYRPDNFKVIKWKQNDDSPTMFAEYGLKPLWDIMLGVSTAQTSLGLDSFLFGGNTYSHQQNHNHNDAGGSHGKKQDLKIKATTVGMVDDVMNAMQVGSTTAPTAAPSLQVPNTIEEMQQILSKSNASSEETILRALLRRHRPLSDAVLDAVCDVCPSPAQASSKFRTSPLSLIPRVESLSDENVKAEFDNVQNAVKECLQSSDPSDATVAHCCKFISTDRAHINDPELFSHLDSLAGEDGADVTAGIILGVARVMCGTLCSKDVEYYCFGPKHKDAVSENVPKREVRLYLIMGSAYIRVNKVPAGHICALHGLEELQLKTVTLSSSRCGMPLNAFNQGLQPLVKVNVEAVSNADTAALERGLAKLSLADAAVEVTATAKGERILACLGEIHLEQSIIDLRNVYIGKEIELRISKPIVDFRESTTWFDNNEADDFQHFYKLDNAILRQNLMPPYCEEDGLIYANNGRSRAIVSGRGIALHVRALPLSNQIHSCLENKSFQESCSDELRKLARALNMKNLDAPQEIFKKLLELSASIDKNGNAIIQSEALNSGLCVKGVVCRPKEPKEVFVVPKAGELTQTEAGESKEEKAGESGAPVKTNIAKEDYEDMIKRISDGHDPDVELSLKDSKTFNIWKNEFRGSLIGGFQSGCASGPLCEEPVRGVLIVLEGVEIAMYERRKKTGTEDDYNIANPITGGMVVAALRTGIRTALLTRPARLMEGHLKLTLHSSLSGLGPLYEVLSKRRGKVLSDTMVEGTDLISIEATLPQFESFGLTSELMKRSSGEVTAPELIFSHWEMLDEDPFWIPTSREDREEYGEIVNNGDISTGLANNALKFIRLVRNRKGLIVDSHKIVVNGEKQRTLARKK